MSGVVIVGAGQAGGRVAEALRERGYAGAVALVGAEAHPPYERPALSKELLAPDARGVEHVAWVRPEAWWTERGVALHLGVAATRIDRAAKRVLLSDGRTLDYDTLVLATGASPRRLAVPGADHPRAFYLRTIEDSLRLDAGLVPGAEIVVVGAGFIGLEVAAAASARGASVTVVEIGTAAMARAVPDAVAAHHVALHRSHGVRFRFRTSVEAIADEAGRAAVLFSDGGRVVADAVVIGVGAVPDLALARDAGLAIDDGLVVDDRGRTSDPHIFAAGDVTRHPNAWLGRPVRLESWQNAQNQAIAVARNILGEDVPYAEAPWFWSDQHGVNLQIAGLPGGDGATFVKRGAPGDGPALWLEIDPRGRLRCAVGIDAGRDMRVAREIMALGRPVDAAALADIQRPLMAILRELKAEGIAA